MKKLLVVIIFMSIVFAYPTKIKVAGEVYNVDVSVTEDRLVFDFDDEDVQISFRIQELLDEISDGVNGEGVYVSSTVNGFANDQIFMNARRINNYFELYYYEEKRMKSFMCVQIKDVPSRWEL